MRAWYSQNRNRTQGEWLLLVLDEFGIRHSMRAEQLGPEAGTSAVPELTAVVLDAEPPWIRSLATRMLRVCTGRDFGNVSPLTPEAARLAICERYRALYEQDKAASGR